MDNPVQDITGVIHSLTQGSPSQQAAALETYFIPNASFTHPFCRTGSFPQSRQLVKAIYRWYKILSPRISLQVHSIALDETNLVLYVTVHQVFSIRAIPFHRSPVTLTSVLQLTTPPNSQKYYITSQNDLYQIDQVVKFFAPWNIGLVIVWLMQILATFFCVVGAVLLSPVTSVEEIWSQWRKWSAGGKAD